jgi:hypothetical protein
MRTIYLVIMLLLASLVYGQEPVRIAHDSLLTAPDWKEVSEGDRTGYILTLTTDGNFEEDAGERHNRPYRYLLGRWKVDAAAGTLTLSVDGQMGKTGVHRRYLKGRDFYLVYTILSLENGKLEVKDKLTGAIRTFTATERKEYVEPAMRRIPKPGIKPGVFKLPAGWGGFQE